MKQVSLFIISVLATLLVFAQDQAGKPDCSILKQGTFKYLDIEDTTAYFNIDKGNHTEYHNNGKYHIKSKLKWLNDCQYEMKMIANTIPGFPYKPGDVMTVTVTRIEEDIIYYTSEVNGGKWDGRLVKLK
jgi:hypothetical protein